MQVVVQWTLRLVVVALLAVHPGAWAGMIEPQPSPIAGADQQQAAQDREKVREFLERGSVRERLQVLGVDGLSAQSRIDALSQEEVHALAQRIDAMPAGGALSQNDWILILLVVIVLLVV